jgi:hypothetical protein
LAPPVLREGESLATTVFRVFRVAVVTKPEMAYSSPRESDPVTRIACARELEQVESLEELFLPQPGKIL